MDDGLESQIKCALLAQNGRRSDRPVAFIENKPVDFIKLQQILQISGRSHHWANFGPVSRLLESGLEQLLQLPQSRSVIFCSSATAALSALIATKEYLAGKPLSWVTSAYGFYSSWLGPLSGAKVLDCDSQGMLNLEALEALAPDSFDGVLITNVFGVSPDIRKYIEFCRLRRKHLIVDNAAVLDGFPHNQPDFPVDEIISFHHTKPWGMGEGGCAVVDSEEAVVLRAMTNFGVGLHKSAASGATNSKISDFSCALILNRMREASEWRPLYREQAQRLQRLALEAGLRTLAPMNLQLLTPPHLPLLSTHQLPYSSLVGDTVVMHKYYLPYSAEHPTAQRLYAHIVNVPCHPGLAQLSDTEIQDCLWPLARGTALTVSVTR